MAGFDWAIHKGDPNGANSDLGIPIFVNQQEFILRDRFDLVEGLSGWKHDDILTGTEQPIGTAPVQGVPLSNNLTRGRCGPDQRSTGYSRRRAFYKSGRGATEP